MGFPHPGTGQSMRRIRYKSGNIQSIIMLSFSLLSFAIMLVTVMVMYIKFADASQDSIIESNHKVMDQTIDSVESYLVNMRQVSDAAYYDVIKEKNHNFVDGLIQLTELWDKLDYPKDSPHTVQGRSAQYCLV